MAQMIGCGICRMAGTTAEKCCIHSPEEGQPKLTDQYQSRFFFHDVTVDLDKHELWTAGLDGLVGVARGSGGTVDSARHRCLELLNAIELPQKQFRTDVGAQANSVLGTLDVMLGLTL